MNRGQKVGSGEKAMVRGSFTSTDDICPRTCLELKLGPRTGPDVKPPPTHNVLML